MDLLGRYRPSGFCYPKFHANTKYPELIRSRGCVALASAGYGESTHKLIKRAYALSNKKSAGLERQVTGLSTQHSCSVLTCLVSHHITRHAPLRILACRVWPVLSSQSAAVLAQIRDFTRRVQLLPRVEGAADDKQARSAVSHSFEHARPVHETCVTCLALSAVVITMMPAGFQTMPDALL